MICTRATIRGLWSRDGESYTASCSCHGAVAITEVDYFGEFAWRAGVGPKPIHWRAP